MNSTCLLPGYCTRIKIDTVLWLLCINWIRVRPLGNDRIRTVDKRCMSKIYIWFFLIGGSANHAIAQIVHVGHRLVLRLEGRKIARRALLGSHDGCARFADTVHN